MAYGVAGIDKVEAWTATDEFADDNVLDADVTGCMTNGTLAESCDEWKEGTLNGRVEIDADPASIISLSVRFYLNDVMTGGNNSVIPYTDINSVSSAEVNEQDYSTSGNWIEHDLSTALIDLLGDVGGGKCALRLASEGGAKSKFGEVHINMVVQTYPIGGISRDSTGGVLPSAEMALWKRTANGDELMVLSTGEVSSTAGVYSFDAGVGTYRVVLVKDQTPQLMDIGPPLVLFEGAVDDVLSLGAFHNFADGDVVIMQQAGTEAIPGGMAEDSTFYITQLSTSNTCKVSTASSSTPVDITSTGAGILTGDLLLS